MSDAEQIFTAIAVVLTFAAVASYVNHRFLKLPATIGLMALSLAVSLVIVALGTVGVLDAGGTRDLVESLHFDEVLLQGLLGYLLFAGALHIDLAALRGVLLQIATLATFSVLASATIAGTAFWGVAHLLGFDIAFIHGLLFGALIAPTDPVAALGILKGVNAPKSLETTIAGESLFNDAIAIVLFVALFLGGWILVSLLLARSPAAAKAEGAYVTGIGNFAKFCKVVGTGIVVGVAFIVISRMLTDSVLGSVLDLPHNEHGRLLEIEDFSDGVDQQRLGQPGNAEKQAVAAGGA